MTELQPESNARLVLNSSDEAAKNHALIAYILMAVGLFTGLFAILGGIWAMVKKEEAAVSIFYDHYSNIIVTFWWSLGLNIVGIILAFVFIGYLMLPLVWIWTAYRIIKGLARITSNKSYKA